MNTVLEKKIFSLTSSEGFEALALEVFNFQYTHVAPYRKFCDLLNVDVASVKKLEDIPFIPVQLFKSNVFLAAGCASEVIFTSSGTTGSTPSSHYVASLEVYRESFQKTFLKYYGNSEELVILALLPSYLERSGSSLVYMADVLIRDTKNSHSGFYLNDLDALVEKLDLLERQQSRTLLLGVSYALLDLIEKKHFKLQHTTVMETGGMKGKRKEMIKEELHTILKEGFGVSEIHSEYGMTELLSQGYSQGHGIFTTPPWMRLLTRDPEDALTYVHGKTGGINVIDLANLYSCSFIATQDLGKIHENGSFEILGRFDDSDIRGCNLMVL